MPGRWKKSIESGSPPCSPTLRIYQQLLKRRRREEYRERVNELLGTSPTATGSAQFAPNSGPNSLLVPGGRSAQG